MEPRRLAVAVALMHISTVAAAELLDRDIQLAFFDIDGTLLGLDGGYTQRLQYAIAAARQAGIKTAVASGRPKFAADFLIDELQLIDAGLFYTGALLYDPSKEITLAQHALDDGLVFALISAAEQLELYTEVCTVDHFYVQKQTDLSHVHSEHLRVTPEACELAELIGNRPIIKLLFAVQRQADHAKLYQLERSFPEAIFAYARLASESEWLFVSVISTKACKYSAFQQLIDYHSVTSDHVIAFGDAQSDMTFLELAGVGVAMGNASDSVKLVADIETLPVWEDGVAVVLEQLCNS